MTGRPLEHSRRVGARLRGRLGRGSAAAELSYWRMMIETRGGEWNESFERSLDPEAPLAEPLVEEPLARMPGDPLDLLDVGAGPLTTLGKVHPTKRLRITAVDPLARHYDRLLAAAGISPPVRTQACAGEKLVERFGPASFDAAYARNAVDHAKDAVLVIEQMFAVLRPGGVLALRHYRNEGETERYSGMHRWNFDVVEERLVLWSPHRRVDLGELLGPEAQVECGLLPNWRHAPFALGVITKRAEPPAA